MFAIEGKGVGPKRFLAPFMSATQYDFWARQLGSTSSWDRCFARVLSRVEEANNTITLRLAPNKNFDGFLTGQHANLTVVINGVRITRSYSFSSTPNKHGWVEFTVSRDPAGLMSRWLFDHAHPGTVLEIDSSFGDMTASTFTDKPLTLLAAGSGITPLMALLREQVEQGMPRPITLVYWVRATDLLCFQRELTEIARNFKDFNVHTVITSEAPNQRISAAQLGELGVDIGGSQVLVCGGNEFVEQASICTVKDAYSFHAEAFTPPKAMAVNEQEQRFTIELTASGRSVEISNQHTLLEALEQQGVAVSSGCRMGICNTCSCMKTSGITNNIDSKAGDADSNSQIRLCVTRAASNLQLAL
jgi:ferredoxin-NADP reductase